MIIGAKPRSDQLRDRRRRCACSGRRACHESPRQVPDIAEMPRTVQDILDHADELARQFEAYEPAAEDERDATVFAALRDAALDRSRTPARTCARRSGAAASARSPSEMQQLEVAALAVHDRATVLQVDVADIQRQHLRRARGSLVEEPPQRLLAHRDITAAPQPPRAARTGSRGVRSAGSRRRSIPTATSAASQPRRRQNATNDRAVAT